MGLGPRTNELRSKSNVHLRSIVPLVFLFAAVSAQTKVAAEIRGTLKNSAVEAPGAELFGAIETGDIDVRFIPLDSTTANVLIENKTKEPLQIRLPEAFAGVPVLTQLGGGGQGVGGGFGGVSGGRVGFINVAPEKVGELKVTTVCLEHGKPDPNPRMKYEIAPIESLTDKPEVIELCKMLGSRAIDQHSVQAAAWHLAHGMSWEELSRKVRRRYWIGTVEPYFSPQHIAFAARIAAEAVRIATSASARSMRVSNGQNESSDLFQAGLIHAEEFRKRLLTTEVDVVSDAELIGQAIERFLQICPASVKRRGDLDDIRLYSYSILRQIRGEDYVDEFGMFEGDAYGLPAPPLPEHHHWHRVETFQPALQIEPALPRVVAAQYDQTNVGFGWNYLVSPDEFSSHQTILGVFYMSDPSNFHTTRVSRPHVGYYGGKGLFVWISPTEVRIERSVKSDATESARTAVTGFSYVIQSGRLRNEGRGFQTVYESKPHHHLRCSRFRMNLRIPGES